MSKPPPRLLDDPEAGKELRDDLRRAALTPVAYDSAAGLASLQAALGAPLAAPPTGGEGATGSSAGTAASASAAGASGKLIVAALSAAVLVAAGASVMWPRPSPSHPGRPAAESRPAAEPASAAAAPAAPENGAPPAATAVPADQHAVGSEHALAPGHASARALPADPDGKLRREIAQLARIKTLLAREPAGAYRLAQDGNREFAGGMLVEEREGLAVLALAQLGRAGEAERRAQAFLARFPHSPLRERIAAIAGGTR